MEDDESVPPAVAAAGFFNGNETNFCYSDDDVVYSEEEKVNIASGWWNLSDFHGCLDLFFGGQPI